MKRPAIFLCGCYLAGIIITTYFSWGLIIILLVLYSIAMSYLMKTYYWKYLILFPVICFFSFLSIYSINDSIESNQVLIQKNNEITSLCKIIEIEEGTGLKLTGVLEAIEIGGEKGIAKGKAIIYIDKADEVYIGDLIEVRGELKLIEKPKNPGAFDAYHYYYGRKIYYKIFAQNFEVIKQQKSNAIAILSKLRNQIAFGIDNCFPRQEAGIVKTMMLGMKYDLDKTIKDFYKIAGLSHLLAISGLHVSILGLGVYKLLRKLFKKERLASLMTILLLIFYCMLTGNNISTVRATLMISTMLLAVLFSKRYDAYSALFASGFILLLYNPYQLFSVGFLLSYFAVGGILFLTPILESKYNKNKASYKSLLFVTIGASLMTYPIILWYFYELPIYALIVNVIVVPFMSLIVGMSGLVALISFFSVTIARLFSGIVYFLLKYIEICCRLISMLPFNLLTIGRLNLITILVYYLILFIIIKGKRLHIKRQYKTGVFVVIIVAIIMIKVLAINTLQITFLDVGQGDGTVIECYHKVFLIDGGGQRSASGSENTGAYVMMPYLKSKGISKIDGIFVSHSDYDHIYGIIEVIKEIPTEFIALSYPYINQGDDLTSELCAIAEEKNIHIYYFNNGDEYHYRDLYLKCLLPEIDTPYYDNNNAKSMVLRLDYKSLSVLFTGDIEALQENILVNSEANIDVDILKVPHHGSMTSSTMNFLYKTLPEVAVFSYGKNNYFGHPSSDVLRRFEILNTKQYHIAETGAVSISYRDGEDYKVSTYYTNRRDIIQCKN